MFGLQTEGKSDFQIIVVWEFFWFWRLKNISYWWFIEKLRNKLTLRTMINLMVDIQKTWENYVVDTTHLLLQLHWSVVPLTFCIHGFCIWGFSQLQIENIWGGKKIPESSKKQNFKLCARNYLHTIYIVFTLFACHLHCITYHE